MQVKHLRKSLVLNIADQTVKNQKTQNLSTYENSLKSLLRAPGWISFDSNWKTNLRTLTLVRKVCFIKMKFNTIGVWEDTKQEWRKETEEKHWIWMEVYPHFRKCTFTICFEYSLIFKYIWWFKGDVNEHWYLSCWKVICKTSSNWVPVEQHTVLGTVVEEISYTKLENS